MEEFGRAADNTTRGLGPTGSCEPGCGETGRPLLVGDDAAYSQLDDLVDLYMAEKEEKKKAKMKKAKKKNTLLLSRIFVKILIILKKK